MAYIMLPSQERTKTGFEAFTEGASPYLQMAFQEMMKRKLQKQQQEEAYREAENLGLITKQPYQEVPIEGGTAQISPLSGIKIPKQFKYKPNKGTSINLKDGIPQFGYEQSDEISQEYKKSQLELNRAYTKALQGQGEQDDTSNIPEGENPEDYIMKPVMRSVRGIPQMFEVPTRKAQVPREDLALLKDLETNKSDLVNNLEFLTKNPEIKNFLGPGLVQRPGAIADIAAQIGFSPKDFPTFKAKSDLAFQKYRKWVTGVQAGYPELQWIVVDYPKPTDKSEIYVSKTLSAIEGMERNKQIYLDFLSSNNYATSKLRNLSEQSQESIQQPDPLGLR